MSTRGIIERLNHLENIPWVFPNRCVMNGRIMVLFILIEKYTMGFSKQMCHDGKGIMLTLIDSLGHNPC